MFKISFKGIFLSVILVTSLFSALNFENADGADKAITASGFGFEKTTIIEYTNSGNTDVETFRLWLGSDMSFKSFKTEKGWTGIKSPQGVLIFTTTTPMKPGESVKFGIKTDQEKPGINWKALDEKDEQIETGKTLVTDQPSVITDEETPKTETPITSAGVLSDSTFRLIPEKPNVGSTVRVTGENFGANQELDFYMDGKKLDSFDTDDSGFFMFTTKIPEDEKADRVDFMVKDNDGKEKSISIRIGEIPDEVRTDEQFPLSIANLPSVIYRGDVILLTGTGNPGGSVTATITDPDGELITTNATDIGTNGKWSYETIVAVDAPLGKYSATITDGKEDILRSWTIESSQKIQIVPSSLIFEPGEPMVFNGTAIPNEDLEVIIENPQGIEIFSDIIEVDSSGFVDIELPTTFADLEGTYVLFAFQEDNAAIVLVGLGELPEAQLIAKMDGLNYKAGDTANVALDGPPSSTLSMIIVDPSDKTKFSDTIVLGPDGKKNYELDLAGYASGVYTIVITRGNAQTEEVFSVGLITGSGPIEIQTTKFEYAPGDPILILGDSGQNILLTLTLIDPDGNEVKVKETFTNKEGKISEGTFRVPSDAKAGTWVINAKSGPNFDNSEFEVVTGVQEGMIIIYEGIRNEPTVGTLIDFRILGTKQSVVIEIYSDSNELVGKLGPLPGSAGQVSTPWPVPDNLPPGTYTIKAEDAHSNTSSTFVYEG